MRPRRPGFAHARVTNGLNIMLPHAAARELSYGDARDSSPGAGAPLKHGPDGL